MRVFFCRTMQTMEFPYKIRSSSGFSYTITGDKPQEGSAAVRTGFLLTLMLLMGLHIVESNLTI